MLSLFNQINNSQDHLAFYLPKCSVVFLKVAFCEMFTMMSIEMLPWSQHNTSIITPSMFPMREQSLYYLVEKAWRTKDAGRLHSVLLRSTDAEGPVGSHVSGHGPKPSSILFFRPVPTSCGHPHAVYRGLSACAEQNNFTEVSVCSFYCCITTTRRAVNRLRV